MDVAARVEKALEKMGLPDWVETTHIGPMLDHTGDPAVRVIVVVRPDREAIVRDGEALTALVQKIHAAAEKAGVDVLVYTRFTVSGQAA